MGEAQTRGRTPGGGGDLDLASRVWPARSSTTKAQHGVEGHEEVHPASRPGARREGRAAQEVDRWRHPARLGCLQDIRRNGRSCWSWRAHGGRGRHSHGGADGGYGALARVRRQQGQDRRRGEDVRGAVAGIWRGDDGSWAKGGRVNVTWLPLG